MWFERDACIRAEETAVPWWSVTYPTDECRAPEQRILTRRLDVGAWSARVCVPCPCGGAVACLRERVCACDG